MPNGKTHDVLTVATGVVGAPVAYLLARHLGYNTQEATQTAFVFGASHLVSGLLFSPDLDNYSVAARRWGALYFIWLPYRAAIPHRSWVSHGLIFSSVLRLLYFIGALSTLFYVYKHTIAVLSTEIGLFVVAIQSFASTSPHVLYAFLIGFIVAGDVHILADKYATRRI
jgi:uncharacterized metal-binding protein